MVDKKNSYRGLPVVDATQPMSFRVTDECIREGVPGDGRKCVLAVAFKKAFGLMFEEIRVGTKVTKVITTDRVIRFNTPGVFQPAIRKFDETHRWDLPVGEYELKPFKNPNRHATIARGKGPRGPGRRATFTGRRVPTRAITRVRPVPAG